MQRWHKRDTMSRAGGGDGDRVGEGAVPGGREPVEHGISPCCLGDLQEGLALRGRFQERSAEPASAGASSAVAASASSSPHARAR
jgi:hypothetical protein